MRLVPLLLRQRAPRKVKPGQIATRFRVSGTVEQWDKRIVYEASGGCEVAWETLPEVKSRHSTRFRMRGRARV